VPSCLVANQRLKDFALYDLDGRPWEYSRNHQGKLILIDFWGTWCVPCLKAIPHLVELQQQYGAYGLEVIGVAYGRDEVEQAQAVKRVRDRMNINYMLLLGGEPATCPVKSGFGVDSFPTLVLLDAYGNVLWHARGVDPGKLRELDHEIRSRLGFR
jgi:thiol-disulfide isomerase/thioredoxin